jgi:hypothetical protein
VPLFCKCNILASPTSPAFVLGIARIANLKPALAVRTISTFPDNPPLSPAHRSPMRPLESLVERLAPNSVKVKEGVPVAENGFHSL